MFIGAGTLINVIAVLAGSTAGTILGHRMPKNVRDVVTDALGLVTLLIAALAAMSVTDQALVDAVGANAPVLIVLGAILIGGITGSMLHIEGRLESLGGWLQRTLVRGTEDRARARFIEGFVTASLIFCVGPLTILGSIDEGLGHGAQQLLVKSVLDGFAAIAFAASFGIGVMLASVSVLVVQGSLTLLGVFLGSFLPGPHVLALTATGGVILAGLGLRLLNVKKIPVGDFLPALIVAPVVTEIVILVS